MDANASKRYVAAENGDLVPTPQDVVEYSTHDASTTANTKSEDLGIEEINVTASHTEGHDTLKRADGKVTPSSLLDHHANPHADLIAHQAGTEPAITSNPTIHSEA